MANFWYDHVHLGSPDPLKTAEFYEQLFDAKRVQVRQRNDGMIVVEVEIPGTRLLITQTTNPIVPGANPGLNHWGMRTDDIESAVSKLKAAGVKFRDEVYEPRPGTKIAFFWAPDNVLIEMLETNPSV